MELEIDFAPFLKSEAMIELISEGQLPNLQSQFEAETELLFTKWVDFASNTPKVYRRRAYLAGLQQESVQNVSNFHTRIIHTKPNIAKKVHGGVEPHDMKPYLLGTMTDETRSDGRRGNTRLMMKDGQVVGIFNTIPFRNMTADMPTALYSMASKLTGTETKLVGGVEQVSKKGGKIHLTKQQIKLISKDKKARQQYKQAMKTRKKMDRKPISIEEFIGRKYDNMIRSRKFYQSKKQSHYMTFRRVSKRYDGKGGSPADSWHHSGHQPMNFPELVLKSLRYGITQRLKLALEQDLKMR